MRRTRGFTLPEILIASGLLLLMLVMMVGLLVSSFALFRRQSGKSETYRGCRLLVDSFKKGLMNSQLETVTISSDGHAISWQRGEPDPPFSATSGEAIMSQDFSVLHWLSAEGRVVHERFQSSAPASSVIPFRLDPSTLSNVRTQSSASERTVVRDVTELSITDDDGDPLLLHPPLLLTVTCQVGTKGTATHDYEDFSMAASVTPRSRRW